MNIYRLELRRNLRSLLIWTVSTAAVFVLVISLYPTMLNSDFMAVLEEKIKLVPKELLDAFSMSGQDIRELPSFFAWIFQLVLMAACLNGAIIGISALAREQSEGTIEFLCTKPVKRSRIASAKLAAACTEYLAYFAVVGIAGILAALCVRPADASPDMIPRLMAALLGGFISGLVYVFLGFALSVFLKRARAAVSIAVALFFGTYVLGMIPSLGMLEFLKWVSPINYFTPGEAVMSGSIDGIKVLVCACVMAVCAVAAYTVYRRKDFQV